MRNGLPDSHPSNNYPVGSVDWHEAMAQLYKDKEFYALVYGVVDDLTWDFTNLRPKLFTKHEAHSRAAQVLREGCKTSPNVCSVSKSVYE